MGLNVFHMFENLHDVCLEDGRLLVMPCNDGCKELHPDIGTPHEIGWYAQTWKCCMQPVPVVWSHLWKPGWRCSN